jgi:hypothetical protein
MGNTVSNALHYICLCIHSCVATLPIYTVVIVLVALLQLDDGTSSNSVHFDLFFYQAQPIHFMCVELCPHTQ